MAVKESIDIVANQRAQFAYKCVKNVVEEESKDVAQKYKSYSKRIMAMVRINGLLATITFIKSNISNKTDGKAYGQLYKDMENWLKSKECSVNFAYKEEKGELLEVLVSLNSDHYRIITKEIMEFVNWIRRFAEGMIRDENSA